MIRTSLVVMFIALGACNTVNSGPGPGGVDAGPTGGRDGGSNNNAFCDGNDCVCPPATPCAFDCQPGSQCDVQSGVGSTVAVQCLATERCEVECHGAASCRVDCAGRDDCEVTCPSGACTVTNIPITDSEVSCDGSPATRTASTASCP